MTQKKVLPKKSGHSRYTWPALFLVVGLLACGSSARWNRAVSQTPAAVGVQVQSEGVTAVTPGCRQVNQTVVCRIDILAANDEATFTIIVTPTITGTLANTATVTAITPGPGPHPITDTVYTVVYP